MLFIYEIKPGVGRVSTRFELSLYAGVCGSTRNWGRENSHTSPPFGRFFQPLGKLL
jgi:hypothetical protein